jgi:hypothetical protein
MSKQYVGNHRIMTTSIIHGRNDNCDNETNRSGRDFLFNSIQSVLSNKTNTDIWRSFIFRPLEYISERQFHADGIIPDLSLNDRPDDIFSFALKARQKYIETGNEYLLHYSYTLFAIAIYGFECSDLRGPFTLGLYFELSRKYREYFADLLKKIRNVSMIHHLSSDVTIEFIDYRDSIIKDLQTILGDKFSFKIEDYPNYDSLLNEQYLIHFRSTVDDYKNFFIKKPCSESALDTFKEYLRDLLLESKVVIQRPLASQVTNWISDSKTYDSDHDEMVVNRNLIRKSPDSRGKFTCNFLFKRTIVDVAPGNVRDTSICNLDTLYSIKYLSFVLRQILDEVPYSAMTRNPLQSLKRKRFLRKSSNFVMLDFKKCGITIPHEVIDILREVLCEIYPDEKDIFEVLTGFLNAHIVTPEGSQKILRGTGLGNGNEICTLIVSAVAHYFYVNEDWRTVVYNDDSVWDIHDHDKRSSINSLLSFFEDIGFEINLRKTFLSRFNVFCEEYSVSKEINWSKRQLSFLPLAGLLLQNSIPNAKRYYHNLVNSFYGSKYDIGHYWVIIKNLYGVEFHDFEYDLPIEVGGWKIYNDSNVSVIIDLLQNPKSYLSASQMKYKSDIVRFVLFLLKSGKASLSSFFQARIKYKSKIPNTFLKEKYVHLFDVEDTIANIFRISSVNDVIQNSEDALNYRGFHNARPRLKLGLDRKTSLMRKKYFKLFWEMKETLPGTYMDYLDGYLINLLREAGKATNFRIPQRYYAITNDLNSTREKKTRAVVINMQGKTYPSISECEGCEQIQHYIVSSTKICRGTDIFFFLNKERERSRVSYRSKNTILLPSSLSRREIPKYWSIYSESVTLSMVDLITKNRSTIVPNPNYKEYEKYLRDDFVNLPKKVFPGCKDLWKNIKRKFSYFQLKTFLYYVYVNGIENKKDFINIYNEILNMKDPEKDPSEDNEVRHVYVPNQKFRNVLFGYPDVEEMLELFAEEISEEREESVKDSSSLNEEEKVDLDDFPPDPGEESDKFSFQSNRSLDSDEERDIMNDLNLEIEDRESKFLNDD